jgi:adenylate cyclase class 2
MPSELEVKFHVAELGVIRRRVLELGAGLASGRHLERNWRFDLPDGSLSARGAVLRLRQDPAGWLAFKERTDEPQLREEIEFGVDDPQAALEFLRGLGYRPIGLYEKYRETFDLGECQVMLDELPFGSFVEIEGPSAEALHRAADRLGLRWERQIRQSYLELFEGLRARLELPVEEASFAAFGRLPPNDRERLAAGTLEAEA